MTECTSYFSPRTSLAAVGVHMRQQGMWEVIEDMVKESDHPHADGQTVGRPDQYSGRG